MGRRRDSATTVEAVPDRLARLTILLTLFSTLVLVDVRAEAAFDAPKRAALIGGVTLATIFAAWSRSMRLRRPGGSVAGIAALAGCAIALAIVSAATTPHHAVATEAVGVGAVLASAALLGASSLFDGRWHQVPAVLVAGTLVNALLALAQRAGLELFDVERVSGRTEAFALFGNEGHLALLVALALVVLADRLLARGWRGSLVAAALPLVALLAISRNATSILIVLAGCTVLVLVRHPVRRGATLVAAGAFVAVLAMGIVFIVQRGGDEAADPVARIDRLLSYRLAPWASASEMIAARPLLGHGPGSFCVESTSYRAAAEGRWHRRLQNPHAPSGAFNEAHNDMLQFAAEAGIPASAALIAAFALLAAGLVRRGSEGEGVLLAALLVSIGVASLTWFPAQIASSALLLSLCAGRGWRLLSSGEDAAELTVLRSRVAFAVLALTLLALVVPHEARRYSAERRLYRATGIARAVEAGRAPGSSTQLLRRVAAEAAEIDDALPGDRRPLVLSASAHLLSGDREAALSGYRAALEAGESAEVDLYIALALRTGTEARDALVRAVWLTDAAAASIPANVRQSVIDDVESRERQLEQGDAGAIPAAPLR